MPGSKAPAMAQDLKSYVHVKRQTNKQENKTHFHKHVPGDWVFPYVPVPFPCSRKDPPPPTCAGGGTQSFAPVWAFPLGQLKAEDNEEEEDA